MTVDQQGKAICILRYALLWLVFVPWMQWCETVRLLWFNVCFAKCICQFDSLLVGWVQRPLLNGVYGLIQYQDPRSSILCYLHFSSREVSQQLSQPSQEVCCITCCGSALWYGCGCWLWEFGECAICGQGEMKTMKPSNVCCLDVLKKSQAIVDPYSDQAGSARLICWAQHGPTINQNNPEIKPTNI